MPLGGFGTEESLIPESFGTVGLKRSRRRRHLTRTRLSSCPSPPWSRHHQFSFFFISLDFILSEHPPHTPLSVFSSRNRVQKRDPDVPPGRRLEKTPDVQVADSRRLCPDLSRDHGLFGADRGHEVLLRQEIQGELDQEAADFAQLLLRAGVVGLGQTQDGLVLLQLRHVPHQGRGEAPEHLDGITQSSEWSTQQEKGRDNHHRPGLQ